MHFLLSKEGILRSVSGFEHANRINGVRAYKFFPDQVMMNKETLKDKIIPVMRNNNSIEVGSAMEPNKTDLDRIGMIIVSESSQKKCREKLTEALNKIVLDII